MRRKQSSSFIYLLKDYFDSKSVHGLNDLVMFFFYHCSSQGLRNQGLIKVTTFYTVLSLSLKKTASWDRK